MTTTQELHDRLMQCDPHQNLETIHDCLLALCTIVGQMQAQEYRQSDPHLETRRHNGYGVDITGTPQNVGAIFARLTHLEYENKTLRELLDGDRPHGEHPTLGECDCDECQRWDAVRDRERKEVQEAAKMREQRDEMLSALKVVLKVTPNMPGLHDRIRKTIAWAESDATEHPDAAGHKCDAPDYIKQRYGNPDVDAEKIRKHRDDLVKAAQAVIDDASPCTSAGQSMVSDELLRNLDAVIIFH